MEWGHISTDKVHRVYLFQNFMLKNHPIPWNGVTMRQSVYTTCVNLKSLLRLKSPHSMEWGNNVTEEHSSFLFYPPLVYENNNLKKITRPKSVLFLACSVRINKCLGAIQGSFMSFRSYRHTSRPLSTTPPACASLEWRHHERTRSCVRKRVK
jgi:hypothetical protein